MRLSLPALAVAALGAALAVPSPARAQIRASEPATVSQTIDGTKFTIQYSRPRARGRTPLFGNRKVVRWGEVWTPGANWATTLDVSKDVKLGGRPVPKGTYSVWMVVRESGDWTFVLDPKARRFHMEHPDSTAAQIRFPVRPDSGSFTEALTWSFPEVSTTGGTLAMQWGTTRVGVKVEVEPSFQVAIAEAEARPYVGSYDFSRPRAPNDTAKGRPLRMVLAYEDGALKGEFQPRVPAWEMDRFAFIRLAPDMFTVGIYDEKGQIYEVLRSEMVITFTREGDRVTGFEIRDETDKPNGFGKRLP